MTSTADKTDSANAVALAGELRAFAGTLKRRLREQADTGDLTPSQVSALLRLEREGAGTTSGLARAEGVRPQSMATIVSVLEAAGLVRGEPDPIDRRQTILSLTDTCRHWISEGRAARQDWLSRKIEERFSADEMTVLAEAIELLKRLVN
jgi:DNA-binding MarR family transcriptional regulator